MPDIDIDFIDRNQAIELFDCVIASRLENNRLTKHNTGLYFHDVPVHAPSNICSIPYDQAEELGYFKVDFLNVGIYKGIRDETHLLSLMEKEPLWELLEQDEFTNLLFHVNGHGNVLRTMKPKSIEELAAVLAIIRPAKRYLIGKDWKTVFNEVWNITNSGEYYFKKSHAIAYAVAIKVQMNLICESITSDNI